MVQRSPLGRVVLRRHYVRPGFQARLVVGRIPVEALLDPDHLTAQPVALNFVAGGMVNHNHVEVGLLVPTALAPGAVQDDALGPGLCQEFPADGHCGGVGALMHHLGQVFSGTVSAHQHDGAPFSLFRTSPQIPQPEPQRPSLCPLYAE